MKDEVYREKQTVIGDFEFSETVADVFDDMIRRSVPGYGLMLSMLELLAKKFVLAESNLYDLGCSLGAGTLRMQRQTPPTCTIHAVDNSKAMIARLRAQLDTTQTAPPVTGRTNTLNQCGQIHLHECDIREIAIEQACFVSLNLTLQFLPVEERTQILRGIFEGLLPGGALLLSEKINFQNTNEQQLLTELHHDFKRTHGYSDLEIAQKRTALENTLITEPLQAHRDRLESVGFGLITPWLQCFNFVSLLAVKAK